MKAHLPSLLAAATLLLATSLLATDTDVRIVASAEDSHVFKTYLKDSQIRLQSQDGVVTLTGTVADDAHKLLAEATVASLPGVKRVENQLTVPDAPPRHSDAWLTAKVKSALLFRKNVSGSKTQVQVRDGFVTLTGVAESQEQKELAAEYARDIEGVTGVRNAITVTRTPDRKPTLGEKIDDASITAQVKFALATHQSTSALKTGVETEDGVVYISGIAKSAAEKELVTRLATDINGVKSVINVMLIQASVTQK